MGNTANNDLTRTMNWTSSSPNTNITGATHWHKRLRGPGYSIHQATLMLRQTKDHKPQSYANIAGVQFKRTTRIGNRHYYRAA